MVISLAFPPGLFGAPPSSAPAPDTLTVAPQLPVCANLRGFNRAEIDAEIARLHQQLVTNGVFAATELPMHEDGSAAIKSQIAVWLLGAAAAAVGKKKLVALSKVNKQKLFSTAGVSGLICEALGSARAADSAA